MGAQDFKREETDRAFEHLYRSHRSDVYRAAMRRTHDHHEAEDVTQSAFLDAYRAVLRGAEPELPRAWLLAIAENVRRRRFATSLRRPRTTPFDHAAAVSTSPDQIRVEEIREALAQLPANQRSAVVLREVAGLSYAEISSRLDVSVPAVQMLLFRARQSLRSALAPSLGRVPGLLAPHWLVALTARFESVSVGARSLGNVGARSLPAVGTAAVAAVAGVGTVSVISGSPRPPVSQVSAAPAAPAARAPVPARLAGVSWAKPTAATAQPVTRGSTAPRRLVNPAVRTNPGASAAAPVAVVTPAAPGAPTPTATPTPSADPTPTATSAPTADPTVVDAAPAAPSPAAPTAASGDGERSAPALIPLPTTIGPVDVPVQVTLPESLQIPVTLPESLPIPVTLPVPVTLPPTVPLPVQVTQPLPVTVQLPVPVPVVEAPSVEVPEVPTLQLPTVPLLPVEVGGALPVLPGL